jgi:GNAT superfamily N-acetyltransferase
MMTIRQAVPADIQTVLSILRSAADWLHSRGYDQWPDGSPSLGLDRIRSQIARGDFWLVSTDDDPTAVIAISWEGDQDFWTAEELAEPAVYLAKAAIVRRSAGEGIGALLLRWACDWAARHGARWARLDAWKTNADLHAYYRALGWDYLRTVDAPGRNSGALFQRPAVLDPEARDAFKLRAIPSQPERPVPIRAGSQVLTDTAEGPVSVVVTQVTVDWSHGVTESGWEHGVGSPPPVYEVVRGSEAWASGYVWADPDRAEDA